MRLIPKISRHVRLSYQARDQRQPGMPPFLILFINSICNMRCDHCFYWESLNAKTDLRFEEIVALSEDLGDLDNLNLSGGEPFLRAEFAAICRQFIRRNHTRQIYCPTNGWYTAKTREHLRSIFREDGIELFTVELSSDGMPEWHDKFRAKAGSFARLLDTYDMLAEFQQQEPRLQIHSITTATAENIAQVVPLSRFLLERCPRMSRHNIALLRGERKRGTLMPPLIAEYLTATQEVSRLWADRKDQSSARVLDPLLHWAKAQTYRRQEQAVPCRAGILTGVVYANGDVSLCEQHPPIGNLRTQTFREIWHSSAAQELRLRIRKNECSCTNEIFLWSSLAFQPLQLAKALRATGTSPGALVSLLRN